MFDQPELERLLRDAVQADPRITLLTGHDVIDIDAHRAGVDVGGLDSAGDQLSVTVRDRESGAAPRLAASAVLGCDGAGSTVREAIGGRMVDLHFTERWLVIDVQCRIQLDVWDGVQQVCDFDRAATFMQVGAERYRWEFRLREGETATDLAAPDMLAELLAPWRRDVGQQSLTILRTAEYTFRARVADRWRSGRVFLLGDAAHLMPPFTGQGMGAGMRDAANLVWKLDLVLRGRAGEALLDTYQNERKPHVTTVIGTAIAVGWAMTRVKNRVPGVRRAVLAVLTRLPARVSPVAGRPPYLRRGPLVLRRRSLRLGALAGRPIPQPWVTADGLGMRLDSALGNGFVVLCLAEPTGEITRLARSLDALLLRLGRPGESSGPGRIIEHDGRLHTWLRRARQDTVLLRPDHTVLDSDRADGRDIAARAGSWLALICDRTDGPRGDPDDQRGVSES